MAGRRKQEPEALATVGQTFELRLLPSGRLTLRGAIAGDGFELAPALAKGLCAAFARGSGAGLLHLAIPLLGAELPAPLAFWREFGREYVARACGSLDPESGAQLVLPAAEPEWLTAMAAAVPPMPGAELLDADRLAALWSEIGETLLVEAGQDAASLERYLKQHESVWHVLGRVCLHLAENKRDAERPFAFLATYVHAVSAQARARHIPLGRALEEHAGTKNRKRLLALLAPLSRAAEGSEVLRELIDSGAIYHPLAWTPQEAYRFLIDVPACERAGLLVRLPDWWTSKKRSRPQVSVRVGEDPPSAVGLDSLLSFDLELSLDGEPLSQAEIDALLASSRGLVLIKGKWVEVDPEQLSEVLEQWRDVQHRAGAAGLSFGEAMRMLAGAPIGSAAAAPDTERPEWSEVVAGDWLRTRLDALQAPDHGAASVEDIELRAELRPYQKAGVRWLHTLRELGLGGCLADDMGLGKTIQVIALIEACRQRGEDGQDLLVVPASLLENWRLEIERFAPGLRVWIAHPSRIPTAKLKTLRPEELTEYDAVITSYGTLLRTEWIRDAQWRHVVLDEAQAIKNPGAKQTKAVKSLRAGWRLALTGTPVENRLGDLWSLFDFVNPGLLGSERAFGQFCKSMANGPNGYAPLRRLVQPYILRRLKTDRSLVPDLPDKTEVTAYCLLSKAQAALYRQSVEELRKQLKESSDMQRRGLVLAYLMRFKQICNHPSQWLGTDDFGEAGSGKFARLRELCEPIAARQDKLLVFTQFREMCAPLERFLACVFGRPGLVLHGNTQVQRRQGLVRRFQEEDDVPFMVLSLKAGGTGLNLTAASHVVHFDRWWNPAVENQATDRAFRIGQKKNVLVHKFVCRGTIEERIDEMIDTKQRLAGELLAADPERALTELGDEELLSLLRLDMSRALEG